MYNNQEPVMGKANQCTTCVFGPGGHGEPECLAANPLLKKITYSNHPHHCDILIQCNKYKDVLSADLVPACKPRKDISISTPTSCASSSSSRSS